MVLSKRERFLAIVVFSVIAVFVFDRYALTPFMEMNERTRIEKQNLDIEFQETARLIKQRKRLENQWQGMIEGGLSSDPAATESRILHVIRQWSQDYGLAISSIKPDRNGNESTILKEINFNVACRGNMNSIGRFIFALENCTLPVRITEFQLGSREADGQDMSLQLRLSAIYLAGDEKRGDRDSDEAAREVKI